AHNAPGFSVLDDVRRHFGYCNSNRPAITFFHPDLFSQANRDPARLPSNTGVGDLQQHLTSGLFAYFHRVTVTFVPTPDFESISKSLTSRFAPPSPSPKPDPVVKPSRSASEMSPMPGPLSTKTSRNPNRGPFSIIRSIAPPPPWINVLRASSLAAVTILVWSTREKPMRELASRTRCLTVTTSDSETTGIVSLDVTAIHCLIA